MEVWKEVVGYEGLYMVSSKGNLKSLNYNKTGLEKEMSSKCVNGSGYCICTLFKDRNRKQFSVHQLVACAFLNHKISGKTLVVNHINFIKTDNRVENLEIVTVRENSNLKHKKSTSKYVGVSWDNTHKKYRARIGVNGFDESLGLYSNEFDAHIAYQQRLKELK